jgi:hypothetical protein
MAPIVAGVTLTLALLAAVLPLAAQPAAEPLRFSTAAGQAVVTLTTAGDTVEVRDAKNELVARIKVEADRVKLRDAKGTERWKIKRKDYGAEIEDGGGQRLFRIRGSAKTEWKLEDAGKTVLARVKIKDGGFEVRDAKGATIAKVKPRDGRVAFESEAGARLYDLRGSADASAALWLSLDRFSPAERAAIWAFFARVGR